MNIKIYCGRSNDREDMPSHPLCAVEEMKSRIDNGQDIAIYTNSPDAVSFAKYYTEKLNIRIDLCFYLNGIYVGDDIEPIFEDFNKALDYINEHS